jgi:hypothetical protein
MPRHNMRLAINRDGDRKMRHASWGAGSAVLAYANRLDCQHFMYARNKCGLPAFGDWRARTRLTE